MLECLLNSSFNLSVLGEKILGQYRGLFLSQFLKLSTDHLSDLQKS
jgi:hypothetical protein